MEQHAGDRRRDGRRTDTRARIHDAALELFVAQGFANTKMQDVADHLGLTKSAVYYHHPTKADLVQSVVQPAIDDVNSFLDEAERAGLGRREVLERFFDLNYTHRRVFIALLQDPSGLSDVQADDWVPHLAKSFQGMLAGPDASAWQRICAVMAANGLSRCAVMFTDVPYVQLRAMAVEAALGTLALPEPS